VREETGEKGTSENVKDRKAKVSRVKPLLKDPLRKGQCINYLYTKDFL